LHCSLFVLYGLILTAGRYSDWLRAGRSGFDYRPGLEILLFSIASRTSLGPTPPPIQWVPVVQRPGREADH